jgi:hypothetical protein
MENSCRDFLILSLNFVDKFFNDGLGDSPSISFLL